MSQLPLPPLSVFVQTTKTPSTSSSASSDSVILQGHSSSSTSPSFCSATPISSSSPAAALPLLGVGSVGKKQGKRRTLLSAQREMNGEQNGDGTNRPFWNRRSLVAILIASFFLLSGTFALFDSLLDNGDGNTGGERQEDEVGLASDDDAKGYLSHYGYIDAPSRDASEPRVYSQRQPEDRQPEDLMGDLSLDSIKSAIQKFQEFAGLPASGLLDNKTRKKMTQPRCGIQDVQMLTSGDYVMKWKSGRLTYQLLHSTDDLPVQIQKRALQMAFDAWSRYVPLEFTEASEYGNADIKVQFARRSHGDPWPFDGRGGILAHATFPKDGKLHFDDDENWAFMDGNKIGNYRYTDLYWVALHEIGHVLGLSHSNIETAIMAPFYQDAQDMVDWRGNYKKPELTSDDIRAAQQIYGKRYSGSNGGGGGARRTNGRHSSTGSDRRTNGGETDDTTDDREGGFWSSLGKMLTGNEDGTNSDNDGEGRPRTEDRTARPQPRSRYHSRRNQQHYNDGGDDSDASFSSANRSALHFTLLKICIFTFTALIFFA